ncbi:unnamed protein product [Blepharisma stoltei]|uniref:Uncharacterized protein n=1 Tax=Blepharisma stoltei TaxID=1481888 RepID=A0AAU9JW72_9CILI|nr:unnamed protein product [Blepharisma stoltei]
MEQSFPEEPISLQLQIDQLKETLKPFNAFIEEISAIKESMNLPNDKNYTITEIICLKSKAENSEEVNSVKKSFFDYKSYMNDINRSISGEFARFNILINEMRNEVNVLTYADLDNKENIKDIKTALYARAFSKELQDLKKYVDTMTPLLIFEEEKAKFENFALKSELEESRAKINKVENTMKIFETKEQAMELIKEINQKFEKLENENKDTVEKIKKCEEFLKENIELTNSKIDYVKNTFELVRERTESKVFSLKEYIESSPWAQDISEIKKNVEDKINKSEMKELRTDISSYVSEMRSHSEAAQTSVTKFSFVLERFDEILLEKSSKDDLEAVKQQLPSFVTKSMFLEQLNMNNTKHSQTQSQILAIYNSQKALESSMQSVISRFESIKRDNQDVSMIARTLEQVYQEINRKADKIEIFDILKVMGKQEDINKISQNNDLAKRQLELTAVLVLALCRTLLKTGENPNSIKKKREDLYRNLGTLVNWIGEDKECKTERSLDLSLTRDEGCNTINTSFKNPIRHKRNSHSLIFQNTKSSLDLPPIKNT